MISSPSAVLSLLASGQRERNLLLIGGRGRSEAVVVDANGRESHYDVATAVTTPLIEGHFIEPSPEGAKTNRWKLRPGVEVMPSRAVEPDDDELTGSD
ncbi:MAG: hypothetical protein PHT12_01590 [Patescibacteria group bacterium]|nr:hypothetical protein [Patescibacteria group bacterium]